MRDFLYRLVERLQDEARPLSRNRHFHAFTGESRQALRIDRHLRDLLQHLDELRELGERPRVRTLPDGGRQLVLRHPRLAVVRTATLSAEEVRILCSKSAGAWALGEDSGAGADSEAATPDVVPAAERG